jgi:hypothetical protein
VDLVKLDEEMRRLAEERVTAIAGDALLLDDQQLAKIWDRSTTWVVKMKKLGRVQTVPFGSWHRVPRAIAIRGLVRGI